ncbi:unnamed protein product [Prorocentrum cordatum]|uniref:60S ribosomal protein L35 n=1 Tax=Prorocentrum cordatum TaxID=2364126 RepID=A0ABN9QFY6_9DINO|nr:unnamed protein product [Polarella glacialis]
MVADSAEHTWSSCDSAWAQYFLSCAQLEEVLGVDCSGCSCPGDVSASGTCDASDGTSFSSNYPCKCGFTNCMTNQVCTSATSACVEPDKLWISVPCWTPSTSEFDRSGVSASGAPVYTNGAQYLYYDLACDGNDATGARWILDDGEPHPAANTDLDGDGMCAYLGYVSSSVETGPPSGTATWEVACAGEPAQALQITISATDPATPAPSGAPTPSPTPAPGPAPTPAPSGAPTPGPTPAPSPARLPTPTPTPPPSPAPSPAPGPAPGPAPSPAPSTTAAPPAAAPGAGEPGGASTTAAAPPPAEATTAAQLDAQLGATTAEADSAWLEIVAVVVGVLALAALVVWGLRGRALSAVRLCGPEGPSRALTTPDNVCAVTCDIVRKSIARILTVYNQKQKAEARKECKGKKYIPLDLRPKKTRALRRALKVEQKTAKTAKEKTRSSNFPMRRFVVTM